MIRILINVAFVVSLLMFHELGHYVVAWKFGWKPKFAIVWRWHMPAFAVVTRDLNFTIETNRDFLKAYGQLSSFFIMALCFPLVAILIYNGIGFIDLQSAYYSCLFFTCYSIFETMNPMLETDGGA